MFSTDIILDTQHSHTCKRVRKSKWILPDGYIVIIVVHIFYSLQFWPIFYPYWLFLVSSFNFHISLCCKHIWPLDYLYWQFETVFMGWCFWWVVKRTLKELWFELQKTNNQIWSYESLRHLWQKSVRLRTERLGANA